MPKKVLWICLLSLFAVSTAHYPQYADARKKTSKLKKGNRLEKKGTNAFMKGDFNSAIELLTSSYALTKKNETLRHIALAHELQGNLDTAIDYMKRYVEKEPNDLESSDKLETLIERNRKALLQDKEEVDRSDALAHARERSYSEEFRDPTCECPQLDPSYCEKRAALKQQKKKKAPAWRAPLGWSLMGLSAISVGTGLYFTLSEQDNANVLIDANLYGNKTKGEVDRRLSARRTDQVGQIVSFSIAALALGGGLTALLWDGNKEEKVKKETKPQLSLTPVLTDKTIGIHGSVRF